MTTQALINPQLVTWARIRAGLSIELLAKKLGIGAADKIDAWEQGTAKPTFVNCGVDAPSNELLLPESAFKTQWQPDIDWQDNLIPISKQFHVSPLVVAKRALDCGFISQESYGKYYQAQLKAFQQKQSSGGSFINNTKAKNGKRLMRAATTQAMSGHMLLRDAAKVLGIQASQIKRFAGDI